MFVEFWHSEPDNGREAWAILAIKTLKGKIFEWKIAYANPVKVVRVVESSSEGDEQPILECLIREIHRCKRGTTLVTFSREILSLLRGKILEHRIKNASFRGLTHFCMENLLLEYFAEQGVADDVSQDPSALWALLTAIGPLVPVRALEGDPL